jgi:RNA polymerase sigma-70 factor (ECF subfamily)
LRRFFTASDSSFLMPSPIIPAPADQSTPSRVRGTAGVSAVSDDRSVDDPFSLPINRGPRGRKASTPEIEEEDQALCDGDEDEASGDEDVAGEESSAEIKDLSQPLDEDRVSHDMSSLALNPTRLNVGQVERPADRENSATLHLNGDFAGMEDSEVMLELKAGNMTAFDYLLGRYRRPIVHFMLRMTRNQAVAEELAQEVFLRVYRSRETYRAEAKFSTWLYRIATNLGVNHARDTRHERTASTVYLDETDPETGSSPDVADATPLAEATMLRDERMAAIRKFVDALPERQKMAVLMHKYEGMDYKQIGEVLKLSESATKSLLFRAYQTLRGTLKDFV